MRYKLILLIAAIFPINLASAIIPGQIVYDPTLDWDIIQTFAYFETEITDLENQLIVLDKQLDALKQLSSDNYQWSDTSALINQLGETLNQSTALSYAARDVDERFHELFPGYVSMDNYNDQYKKITSSTLESINNALLNLGMSSADFTNETSRLKLLQKYSQNVIGQTQAIQVANQIASEEISQLQLIRQTLMVQANSQALFYAQQIQKEASATAELNELISHGNSNTTGVLDQHPLNNPNYR